MNASGIRVVMKWSFHAEETVVGTVFKEENVWSHKELSEDQY